MKVRFSALRTIRPYHGQRTHAELRALACLNPAKRADQLDVGLAETLQVILGERERGEKLVSRAARE